jgi:type II secretory pathway pseudopilin PulG
MKQFKRWLAIILMGAVAHLLMPWSVHAQRTEEEQNAEDVQRQAEEAQKALELFLREQRVVFRRGEGTLELGLLYSLDTKETFLRSAEGTVFVAKLTKRTILPNLTLRYAPVNDLELDIIAPFYGYSELETDLGGAHQWRSDSGPADITGLMRYQLWH